MGLNYKEEAMIDETRDILVRVREQEDDGNEGCFNTKPKPFKSALDAYLQLNFLFESESCRSSISAAVESSQGSGEKHCIMLVSPYSCCPS